MAGEFRKDTLAVRLTERGKSAVDFRRMTAPPAAKPPTVERDGGAIDETGTAVSRPIRAGEAYLKTTKDAPESLAAWERIRIKLAAFAATMQAAMNTPEYRQAEMQAPTVARTGRCDWPGKG